MAEAEVGDDVFIEDPTVNRLQERAAQIFGREAGLYVPSGSMGNLTCILAQTHPGQEVICEESGHIYNYEMAAMSGIGGVLAYSRILAENEVLVVANTSANQSFSGWILVDLDIARPGRPRTIEFSNLGASGTVTVDSIPGASFHHEDGSVHTGDIAATRLTLRPSEIQIVA